MAYDDGNIFARILRDEIPCDRIYEDAHALVFRDVNPQTPVHVLVIPKGRYESSQDFHATASTEEIAGFYRAAARAADQLGIVADGYRSLANHGRDAHQEVPHYHLHLFAGANLGRMIRPPEKARPRPDET